MGATIYGGGVDQVGLNEDSIWSGPYQYRPVPDGPEARPIANAMLLAGNISEANDYIMRTMTPVVDSERQFSYFGNLYLDFGHGDSDMENYVRWLDTAQGNAGLSYSYNGANYT